MTELSIVEILGSFNFPVAIKRDVAIIKIMIATYFKSIVKLKF